MIIVLIVCNAYIFLIYLLYFITHILMYNKLIILHQYLSLLSKQVPVCYTSQLSRV